MSAYHFKYFQNIQFKNHGIAPTPPPDLPTLKAYPTPGVGGRFEIFSLKWRERMNLKVPGAILPLGCAILSTRAKTVREGLVQPPLKRTRVNCYSEPQWKHVIITKITFTEFAKAYFFNQRRSLYTIRIISLWQWIFKKKRSNTSAKAA